MEKFTAYQMQVAAEVQTTIQLNEHKGSAIRGALYHALRGSPNPRGWHGFCVQKHLTSCAECPVVGTCPVALLVSTLDTKSRRGRDVVRPYAIMPSLDYEKTCYEPGEQLDFTITLFADAFSLLPYVVLALQRLQYEGLGRRLPREGDRWRRGTARVSAIVARNPLAGTSQPMLRDGNRVDVPDLAITHRQVLDFAATLPRDQITLELLTPLRLVERGRLVKVLQFRPFFQRLLERLINLSVQFSPTPLKEALTDQGVRDLVLAAESVETVDADVRWVELRSYSTRRKREMPIGGLMGRVTFAGDLAPFLPWLVWGTVTQVGKDVVKGNGGYELKPPQPPNPGGSRLIFPRGEWSPPQPPNPGGSRLISPRGEWSAPQPPNPGGVAVFPPNLGGYGGREAGRLDQEQQKEDKAWPSSNI